MKLNPDCIRDILLYLEENLTIVNHEFIPITLKTLQDNLTKYSKEDVFYSVYNLKQVRFIEGRFCDVADTPTAKARWVLMCIHFQIYSKAYKTNEFP